MQGQLRFEGERLSLQEHIKILGITTNRELRYGTHITSVALQTSQRKSALHWVVGSLDLWGILTLYRAQICHCMEYGALTWMSSTTTHTRHLDAVKRHALHLLGKDKEITASIMSLEHRRDVATLMACHKAWVQHTPHLTCLSLPPYSLRRMTRQAGAGDHGNGNVYTRDESGTLGLASHTVL
ncbi:hypothetical protein E2C01_060427 [Portunus trituberculatus]|uniref:RNA-directed DNA polymerase from mobile element jockey n=1 Tax=Portunus trituberculatus TaxID=210409 RepID=A0A5B7H2G3_PORTR|nr:hypothetical protein [Portunus trituberculatus]